MSSTLVIIRCTRIDERVNYLATTFNGLGSNVKAVAVPDCISGSIIEADNSLFDILPLDSEFVVNNGLHFYGDRTGWLCGDYVFYRALELNWDYAWVVEPDVFFLNGSEKFVLDSISLDYDLMGTHLWKASPKWHWSAPLQNLESKLEVYGLAFPFLRISRDLAYDSFRLRQSFTSRLHEGVQVPNDESVVSSVAKANGRSRFDMKSANPELFKYWRTTVKFPIDDLAEHEECPRIVHSGVSTERFLEFAHRWWNEVPSGSVGSKDKLLASLEACSPELKFQFLEELITQRWGEEKDMSAV